VHDIKNNIYCVLTTILFGLNGTLCRHSCIFFYKIDYIKDINFQYQEILVNIVGIFPAERTDVAL
jgi:hypothetical protein